MEMQQIFGQRLEQLLSEKGISQGEFAEAVNCSRQSINFYILGKRNPDIALAGNPDFGWGWFVDKKFDIIQTDWCIMLKKYLDLKNM